MNNSIELIHLSQDEIEQMRNNMPYGKFKVGDIIKGYSFEPIGPGREKYLQGEIIGFIVHPYMGGYMFEIRITENTENPNDTSELGYIPVRMTSDDYWSVERVQKIN